MTDSTGCGWRASDNHAHVHLQTLSRSKKNAQRRINDGTTSETLGHHLCGVGVVSNLYCGPFTWALNKSRVLWARSDPGTENSLTAWCHATSGACPKDIIHIPLCYLELSSLCATGIHVGMLQGSCTIIDMKVPDGSLPCSRIRSILITLPCSMEIVELLLSPCVQGQILALAPPNYCFRIGYFLFLLLLHGRFCSSISHWVLSSECKCL